MVRWLQRNAAVNGAAALSCAAAAACCCYEGERASERAKWGAQRGQQMKASAWRARQAGCDARRASPAHGGHAASAL